MKFELQVPVDSVDGHQIWEVEASSEEEAIRKFQDGEKCELVEEELVVTGLRDADIRVIQSYE